MTVEECLNLIRDEFGENTYMEKRIREIMKEGKKITIREESNATYIVCGELNPILFADAIRSILDSSDNY
ncbi:hypothetical protein D1872_164720 [compost metagenome]